MDIEIQKPGYLYLKSLIWKSLFVLIGGAFIHNGSTTGSIGTQLLLSGVT